MVTRRPRWALGRGAVLGFGLAFLLPIACGVAANVEFRRTREAGDLARHTAGVLHQVQVVLTALLDTETGQRGFLLTGDRSYLVPYQRAAAAVPVEMARLRELTADDPAHQERMDKLDSLVVSKLTEIESTIHLRTIQGAEAALEVVRTDYGRNVMDESRAILAQMVDEEQGLLKQRLQARERRSLWTTLLIALGSTFASAIVATLTLALNAQARERQRAEAKLSEANERLQVTLRSIGDAVIATDPAGKVVFLNTIAQSLTGWQEPEAHGRALDEVFAIVNEQTRERVESPVDKVLRLGSIVGLANHTILVSRDGRETPVDDCGAPIRDAGGEIMGVVLVFRDVSERRQADAEREKALRAEVEKEAAARALERTESSLALLQTIFDTAPIGLGFFDREFRFVRLNRALAEMNGLPVEEHLGRRVAEVLPNMDPRVVADFERAIRTGEPILGAEVTGETPAAPGELRSWRASYVPVQTQLAGTLGLAVVVEEVTDRKREEEERARLLWLAEEARTEAEAASQAKDEFLAIVSHELRSPLAAMAGWIRVLGDHCRGDETIDHAVQTLERNVRVQTQIISDLLDVSSSISGKLQIERRVVDVAAIVEASIESARPIAEGRGIELSCAFEARPLLVRGDAGRLLQVLSNLVNNSLKFTSSGSIAVAATVHGETALVRVSDTGRGIEPSFLAHVFERFRQSESVSTRTHGGLGLGLAIVKSIVELHGGTVRAESPGAGLGATFTVELPLAVGATEQDPAPAPVAPVAGGAGLQGLRVLLVEDDVDTREALTLLLEEQGVHIDAAGSMAGALEAYQRGAPDLLLSDIGLPGGSGYDLIRRIRELDALAPRRTLAIAMTGFAGRQDHEAALRAGFDEHLQKPVDVDVLLERVRVLVASLPRRRIG